MAKRKTGVLKLSKNSHATHYKLVRDKTSEDKIPHYKIITSIVEPACAQNLRKRKVIRGLSKSKDLQVPKLCSGERGASHVKISGKKGIFIVPMCVTHNDSGWQTAAPICGDTVILKSGTIAVKVANDKGKSRKSNNNNIKILKKSAIFRRAKNAGQTRWTWKGKPMGKVDKYTIDKNSRRVRLKKT